MRDFTNMERYLNELSQDIYPQPNDQWHTEQSDWLFTNWISKLQGCKTLLDVGMGDGFCQPFAAQYGLIWSGVTLGPEYDECRRLGLDVYNYDFSFLDNFHDGSYDIILARHVLEHSPMPLLTLMEWHRVAKQFLCVVLPQPEKFTFVGRNHYSVMPHVQLIWLAARAGWKVIWENITDEEIRVMFEKSREKRVE